MSKISEGNLSSTDRFNRISESGLCIGCGLCEGIAGRKRIQMKVTEQGYERPVVVGELDDKLVDQIYDTCPGTRVEGLPQDLVEADTRCDKVWGYYRQIIHLHASDPEVRFRASTGGALSGLALYLIDSGEVDFILHVKASEKYPAFGEMHLSFSIQDVIDGAGARYGPAAPLIKIRELLDRNQNFAFIGKPCDIGALRNYARHDERVNKLVKYWLTPVCGGFMPPASTRAFVKKLDIDPENVKSIRYRGHGCPGPTRVETFDGVVVEKNYLDFWGTDETQWRLPFRCKVCPDGIGESADLAAADDWPGGSPDREGQQQDPGTNAVMVRTRAGEVLLQRAVDAGFITLREPLGISDMNLFQPHQVNKKYAVAARHQGLRQAGLVYPLTEGLRIDELSSEMTDEFNQAQTAGTIARIEKGKVCEATPR